MKVKQATYCKECKEVFKRAKICPACGSPKVVPLVKLWRSLLNLTEIIKGELRAATK